MSSCSAHSHYWEPLPAVIPVQGLEEDGGGTLLLIALPVGKGQEQGYRM